MKVFIDFEASSLSDASHPIEVAWVFHDGRSEGHLIAPAPAWTDWDPRSEAIHGISRSELVAAGEPHDLVAARMIEALSGHDLYASASSWDGKWLSVLLRTAGLPRRALQLRDVDDVLRETATDILQSVFTGPRLAKEVHNLIARSLAAVPDSPAHRALPDAVEEHRTWLRLRDEARAMVAAAG